MRRLLKILKYSGIILACLIIVSIIAIRILIIVKIPDFDKTIKSSYLSDTVQVIRDNWGIPHITAHNVKDAYFAYGYTIAQDRLFQMDIQRHIAQGKLSELFGKDALEVDRKYRTFLFKYTAENYLAKTDMINPKALEILDAFLEGVNHYIREDNPPIEYFLLGIKPESFNRLDSIAMVGVMAYSFLDGINTDALYSQIEKDFPDHEIDELFPGYSREKPVTVMESQAFYNASAGAKVNTEDVPGANDRTEKDVFDNSLFILLKEKLDRSYSSLQGILDMAPPFQGSNAWLISPFRSKTGMPVLANDPHIGISNPSTWYEAHIRYGEFENYGYFLPTIPFPLLCHNKNRAIGLTMFENDDVNLYYETFYPDDETLVKYCGRWEKVIIINETIKVKGCEDIPLKIRITPHGPVITDFLPGYKGKPVSMQWVYNSENNPVLDVLYGMAYSKNMNEFENAISRLAAPGLNFLYADQKGNIAWWAAGRILLLPPHITGNKILDGSNGRDELLGYLPFEQNPHLVNPESGIIVSANNKPTSKQVGPIKDLFGYWCSSDRAERIAAILSTKEKWDIEDLKKIQTDVKSIAAPDIVKIIVNSIEAENKNNSGLSEIEQIALNRLENWDYQITTDSIGASIYHDTIYYIMKLALVDELGEDRFRVYFSLNGHWNFFKAFIKNNDSKFWDNITTQEVETGIQIIGSAFMACVKDLSERLGRDVNSWKWGALKKIEFVHPFGRLKPLNLVYNIGPYPVSGEMHVINRMKSDWPAHNFQTITIPSVRELISFDDPDKSSTILPTGNSGIMGSTHYNDQVSKYLKGEYRYINFSEKQIEKNKKHELKFYPGK